MAKQIISEEFKRMQKLAGVYLNEDLNIDEYEITADDKIEGRPCVDFKPKELKSNDIIYRKLVDVTNYYSNWYKDKTKIPGGEDLSSYDKPKEFEVVSNDGKILKLKEK